VRHSTQVPRTGRSQAGRQGAAGRLRRVPSWTLWALGLVEQNAAGAQWAIPTGTERGISVLNRIPVSVEARGGTSSTNLQSPEFYWFTELVVTLFNSFTSPDRCVSACLPGRPARCDLARPCGKAFLVRERHFGSLRAAEIGSFRSCSEMICCC
jgi:hypothetical protein